MSTNLAEPQIDVDLYSTPNASLQIDGEPDSVLRQASRAQRFFGAVVDYTIYLLALAVGGLGAGFFATDIQDPDVHLAVVSDFMEIAFAIAVIVQANLLGSLGQSAGKILLRTRIVDAETGEHPGFLRAVVIRSWLLSFACFWPWLNSVSGGLPSIGPWVYWIGCAVIFGKDRRCVHDYLARTRVVSVGR